MSRILVCFSLLMVLGETLTDVRASFVEAGEIAHNFTLNNRYTKQPVSLTDFAGKIIFIDLFAYW